MYFIFALILIAVDQLSKFWVATTLTFGERNPLGLGFYLTHTKNTGAAFGILQNSTLLLGALSAIVSLLLIIYLVKQAKHMHSLQRSALTLILAGALGNMIDRFRLGYVTDFIDFYLPKINFDFAVFNVADSCVVIGAGLLMLTNFLPREKANKDEDASDKNLTQSPQTSSQEL